MQIMITHGRLARTRVLQLGPWQMALLLFVLAGLMLALSGAIYHFIFLKAARDGWPVVSSLVKLVVKDEFAQRDRFMRENLDAMAQRVGEMQAKLIHLEAVGDRVSGLAGLKPEDLRPEELKPAALKATDKLPGQGGPFVPSDKPSLSELNRAIDLLDDVSAQRADVFTMIESRLFEEQMKSLMVPNSKPVDGHTSSGFGFRSDPFSGRSALHTGLDFPANSGAPIMAAAGGVVVRSEYHPQYGNLIDLDHGNGLVTRYAHASKLIAAQGDLVKRGQVIAQVGSTGRSTGPHLHFEVLLNGVHQDPAKFLAGGGRSSHRAPAALAAASPRSRTVASATGGASPAAP
ncbi:M23 family metallopeptidase [Aquabacterium sp. A7-Y]|uniref:M23 family metallopeptidase n=1 Tax=Aquabacterium sp. A7-Y TaxID=1349605 RepID=UPI00223CB548|nr:M23 family metallopeptidase [Aquabacterium sp. A7-Y]MCW7537183.1 M23 family metallopeptidase [Aquabacterium sp. A7-Y]